MSDERKIKSLLKQAQKMVHSSPQDSVAQKLAKRRSILLRGAQRDTEKGRDHEMEFGESKKHGKKITKLHGKEYPKGTHMCATHVEHAEWGEGKPIHSQHAAPDENGHIDWYDVMFEHGIEKHVSIDEMTVLSESSHENHDHSDHEGEELEEKKVSAPKGFHFMKHGDGKYKLMKHKGKFKPHKGGSLEAEFPLQKVHTEGYGDSTPTSFGPFKGHEAKHAGKDRHGFDVYDLFKDGEKVSSGHTSRAIEKKMDQLKTESYFGRMESMGKKMGKMARRLGKEK